MDQCAAKLADSGVHLERRNVTATDHCALTVARKGVAETGSLALYSSVETPILANFLPENSIVWLRASDLVAHLEQAWPSGDMPRAVNLITGPSKTADIEQTIVYGAHGPKRLHIIISLD